MAATTIVIISDWIPLLSMEVMITSIRTGSPVAITWSISPSASRVSSGAMSFSRSTLISPAFAPFWEFTPTRMTAPSKTYDFVSLFPSDSTQWSTLMALIR